MSGRTVAAEHLAAGDRVIRHGLPRTVASVRPTKAGTLRVSFTDTAFCVCVPEYLFPLPDDEE